MNANNIRWLQVEATTKCNAWCPGCARNDGGYQLSNNLIIEDLNAKHYACLLEQFPNLETVDFCGTHGDAIAAANIIELTELTKKHTKKIIVRTNGSLRTTSWWKEYAELLKNHEHEVWFCLDGLAGVHEIYRQATDFDTIIKNAQAFMSAGGIAVWQFIPWKHNEHQITDCIRLSQQLGFKRFEFIKGVRVGFTPRNYQTGDTFEIKTWSKNNVMSKYEFNKSQVEKSNCQHLMQQSVYVNASGTVSNCCYFNNQRATKDVTQLTDIEQEIKENPHKNCLFHCGS
jgi:sulfatase maturation enzyme AslB (radical SAM superfamily)